MIREDGFLISRRPYAIDLGSMQFRPVQHDPAWSRVTFWAVWYRRKSGVLSAHIGTLSEMVPARVYTAEQVLKGQFTDGRYGGTCMGRWDGTGYWGESRPDIIAEHLAILRPMLDSFPVAPAGFDGWWTFQKEKG